jgi:protein-disulfide isomerase
MGSTILGHATITLHYSIIDMKIIQHARHGLSTLCHKIGSINTAGAIIIAAVILGGSHVAATAIKSNSGERKATATTFLGAPISKNDFATGNTKSKVILVEYSDTECPFCARLQPTMKQIKAEYASKVGFVYRYFPLTQIHPGAFEEARAVHCVGVVSGKEKRAEYIAAIFDEKTGKQNMTFTPDRKEALARGLGVNESELKACMADQASSQVITDSIADGVKAGVQGTPATFVLVKNKKGYDVVSLVDGARPYEFVKAAIEEALAR